MAIKIEKILTEGIMEYMAEHGHCYNITYVSSVSGDIKKFTQEVPSDAEIVTDYKLFKFLGQHLQGGTALIPKKKEDILKVEG